VPSRLTDRERLIEFRDEGEFRRGSGRRTPLLWELLARDALRIEPSPMLATVERGSGAARGAVIRAGAVERTRDDVVAAPAVGHAVPRRYVDRATVLGLSTLVLVLVAIALTVARL
jgi:hypothetical protein